MMSLAYAYMHDAIAIKAINVSITSKNFLIFFKNLLRREVVVLRGTLLCTVEKGSLMHTIC